MFWSVKFVCRTERQEIEREQRRGAHLKIGKANDAAEIVEYGYVRYGRRVEARDALPGSSEPCIIGYATRTTHVMNNRKKTNKDGHRAKQRNGIFLLENKSDRCAWACSGGTMGHAR